jgi:CRP-like cAMP-binding protein
MSNDLAVTMFSCQIFSLLPADTNYLPLLMEKLAPYLTYRLYLAGKRFSYSAEHQPDCYFIRQGSVSLYRQPNDILVEIFEAPSLRGIVPVHDASLSMFTLRVVEPAEIAVLDKTRFYALLTELCLWEDYARHLQLLASIATEVLFRLSSPAAFEQIRYQLYELMSKSQSIRESITAENYIRGKTRLSRSSIMNTLSELKKGGYISIDDGILKGIHYIPSRF